MCWDMHRHFLLLKSAIFKTVSTSKKKKKKTELDWKLTFYQLDFVVPFFLTHFSFVFVVFTVPKPPSTTRIFMHISFPWLLPNLFILLLIKAFYCSTGCSCIFSISWVQAVRAQQRALAMDLNKMSAVSRHLFPSEWPHSMMPSKIP